jgi:hypothetical protein
MSFQILCTSGKILLSRNTLYQMTAVAAQIRTIPFISLVLLGSRLGSLALDRKLATPGHPLPLLAVNPTVLRWVFGYERLPSLLVELARLLRLRDATDDERLIVSLGVSRTANLGQHRE